MSARNQTSVTAIHVRPVEGRTQDPFRGTLDESPNRLVSRATDSQPFDAVLAAIEGIALVEVKRAGRRLGLRRADETLKVAFVTGARRVTLDDLVIEGDGRLALAVMHALLPLFGPVEVRIGRFNDLIDGHEPLATVVERFDAWFVEDSLRVAKKLDARTAATAEYAGGIGAGIAERHAKRLSGKALALVAVAFIAVVLGGLGVSRLLQGRAVGESCMNSRECDSKQCLAREPIEETVINGLTMPQVHHAPLDPSGVCTQHCGSDADCPSSMSCEVLASVGFSGLSSHVAGCVPRAWHADTEPAAP